MQTAIPTAFLISITIIGAVAVLALAAAIRHTAIFIKERFNA